MSRPPKPQNIRKRGIAVLQDPLLNKGSAFTLAEREALQLQGLLPPHVSTPAEQARRTYAAITSSSEPLDRYVALLALQDRNEHLFYRLLTEHLAEFMPIVYTPTVGLACQNFSHVFQRARGLWLDPGMKGNLTEVLRNAVGEQNIRLIVATDNESILGIGDQGAGGMAISVGKLALYVAGAGLHPGETLPVSLDVGTNNQDLLDDELYLGWREPRLRGQAYQDFIDEFVDAVRTVCPEALLQWEDFRKDNAVSILQRHRTSLLSFNDDIQGTGAVALAGLYSAMRISDTDWSQQRVVIHGAGAAGVGIANQIKVALKLEGIEDMEGRIAVLDSKGLLVDDQEISDAYKASMAWSAATAEKHGLGDSGKRALDDVVRLFKPTMLIGTSGQPGVFDEQIVKRMCEHTARPIILPFSNPTTLSEATPEDVIRWSDGKALVATGSPFAPVTHNGETFVIGQGNNVFIFPGLGLGALLARSSSVTDEMVTVAARACADAMLDDELDKGMLYPTIERLRDVSSQVARQVALQAIEQGITNVSSAEVDSALATELWHPDYPDLQPV